MMTSRREFMRLVVGALMWPAASAAQQTDRRRVIGFLGPNTRPVAASWIAAFELRLRELGWVEGKTVTIDYRWVEGRNERFAEIATDFARRNVDVIVTSGTPGVMALRRATSTIPIVFATAGDPVKTGLVVSLARPGGNITGLATVGDEVAGKRLQLLQAVTPRLRHLAVLGNVTNAFTVLEMGDVQSSANNRGIKTTALKIRRAEDIAGAFASLAGIGADALYVCTDAALVHTHRAQINAAALKARLPTMHGAKTYLEGGGLMSYGANFAAMFRRSADYVDKILRGARPAEMPVEQPTKFDLVVNTRTAKALGVTIPPTVLASVDEVVE